jgi:hypothetical protein
VVVSVQHILLRAASSSLCGTQRTNGIIVSCRNAGCKFDAFLLHSAPTDMYSLQQVGSSCLHLDSNIHAAGVLGTKL